MATAAATTKSKKKSAPKKTTVKSKSAKPVKKQSKPKKPKAVLQSIHEIVANEKGFFLDDVALEAEVTAFISEYTGKDYSDLQRPAIVLSKLRVLYNAYSTKIDRCKGITNGVLTKYGIKRGMLLNIEKKLIQKSGQEWLEHFTQQYGERSLRTAQDYMQLADTPKILEYAAIGKERLLRLLRAIKTLGISGVDPIKTLFRQSGITFNPRDYNNEDKLAELKKGIDIIVAQARIKKAEDKKGIELEINQDHINNLIDNGVSVNGEFITDLFELKQEDRDINSHIEGLCNESGTGDSLLPHIKKTAVLPKIVEQLKSTVESLQGNSTLINRVEQDDIDALVQSVEQLKDLFNNHSSG
jgi:hypothetical protein